MSLTAPEAVPSWAWDLERREQWPDSWEQTESNQEVVAKLEARFKQIDSMFWWEWEWRSFFVDNMNDYLVRNYPWVRLVFNDDWEIKIENNDANELLSKLFDELKIESWEDWRSQIYIDSDGDNEYSSWDISFEVAEWKVEVSWEVLNDQDIQWLSSWELIQMGNNDSEMLYNNLVTENPDWSLTINFRNNQWAEANIWLSDILPESAKSVRVTKAEWWTVEWDRRWLKWGFYSEWGYYIPVFSWDKVEITWEYTEEELTKLREVNNEQLSWFLENDAIKELYMEDWEVNEEKKEAVWLAVSKAIEYDLDPNLILAVWVNEGLFDWSMGIVNWDLWTLDWQLVMLCRKVQSSMAKWHQLWLEWWEDWLVDSWNILYAINNAWLRWFSWQNFDHFWKIVESYWKLSWREYSQAEVVAEVNRYRDTNLWRRITWSWWYSWEVVRWYDSSHINPENLAMWDLELNLPDFDSLLATSWWSEFAQYKDAMLDICDKLQIPPEVLLQLFIKEWSHWNPYASPWSSSAVWLWQIIDWTWQGITRQGWTASKYWIEWMSFDRFNVDHQIIWSAVYLREMYDLKGSRWMAMVHYHTWPWRMSDSYASQCAERNPAIKRWISWPVTAQSYYDSAFRYYSTV